MRDSLRGAWRSQLIGAPFLANVRNFLVNFLTLLIGIPISYFLRLKSLIRRANLLLVLTKIGFVFSGIILGAFGFVRGVKKKVEATLMIEVASTFRF